MFTHGFPYTNFHDLNLDWIIKTIKILFSKSVFSINNIEPDDSGNVTITGAELGAVATINNIAPVNGNITLDASDVGAIAQGVGVTKVNGFGPDASGNVLAGTVRSINGISPTSLPTPGSITLTPADIGAPTLAQTVRSVNGTPPDARGNVNLPTVAGVTSVNGTGPDSEGNVDVGTIRTINNIAPTNANVTLTPENVGFASANYYVDGTNGSDSNSGTTSQTPFKTISKAVTTIQNSVYAPLKIIVHIKGGTYNERVRAYFWNSSTIQLNAEDGEVEIAEINLSGSKQIHFTSNSNNTYGFTFKKNTATASTDLMAFAFTELYTECPIKIDPQSDSSMVPLNITQGSKFVIGYRGQLSFVNVTSANAFRIHCSEMFSTWGTISTSVTTYEATHAIVCGVTNMTASGSALTI